MESSKREWEKIINFRKNYGRNVARLSEICDCALTLERIEEQQREACNVQRNRTEYEESDNQGIWDWYYNQRGGSCNG